MTETGQVRRGQSAVVAARLEHEVSTERLVNRARQIGVVLGLVQFGIFSDYLPWTREAGLLIAAGYGITAWWSSRVLDTEPDLAAVRRLTVTTLVIDAGLLGATALILAYQDDPTNLLLMVLPLFEGAMKRQLTGALALAGAAVGIELLRVAIRVRVHDLPVEPAVSTFFAGMIILIGLFAGGIVRLQMATQDQLAHVNDRLATTRRLLRSGLASFADGSGLADILEQAVEGFAIEAAVVSHRSGQVVAVPPAAADEPVVRLLVDRLRHSTEVKAREQSADGGTWLALVIDRRDRDDPVLVVRADTSLGIEDGHALRAELATLLRATSALHAEEALRRERARLERLRGDFVAITTTELRTPVTVIKGAVELMRSPAGSERAQELLAVADRQARRLERVVEDLQVIQRLDEGVLGVRHRLVAMEQVVGGVLQDVSPEHAQSVSVAVSPGLSAWADEQLLSTVVRCLVDNAFVHGDAQDVRVVATVDGDDVVLDVSDAGPGVPAELRSAVFERAQDRNGGGLGPGLGTGLGLPLARQLAQLMDGDVVLVDDSRTTFRLRVPARR